MPDDPTLGPGNVAGQPAEQDQTQKRALQMGLLAAGLGMLSARTGGNIWQAAGEGGLTGMDAYAGYLNNARQAQQQQIQQQFERQKIEEESRKTDIAGYRADIESKKLDALMDKPEKETDYQRRYDHYMHDHPNSTGSEADKAIAGYAPQATLPVRVAEIQETGKQSRQTADYKQQLKDAFVAAHPNEWQALVNTHPEIANDPDAANKLINNFETIKADPRYQNQVRLLNEKDRIQQARETRQNQFKEKFLQETTNIKSMADLQKSLGTPFKDASGGIWTKSIAPDPGTGFQAVKFTLSNPGVFENTREWLVGGPAKAFYVPLADMKGFGGSGEIATPNPSETGPLADAGGVRAASFKPTTSMLSFLKSHGVSYSADIPPGVKPMIGDRFYVGNLDDGRPVYSDGKKGLFPLKASAAKKASAAVTPATSDTPPAGAVRIPGKNYKGKPAYRTTDGKIWTP